MKTFGYEDTQLIPNKCIAESRSECDTTIQFGPRRFKLPVVPANMQTVMSEKLAKWFIENDYFYIIHRFDEEARIPFIRHMQNSGLFASISVSIKKAGFDFIEKLAQEKLIPKCITIDIAHGYSDPVINMIKHIKARIPDSLVITGNVGMPEGVRGLENAGANATRVDTGPGRVCITKTKTGFGTGGQQLAALNIYNKATREPLIADGGTRTRGGITRSIRFNVSITVTGSLFAAYEEPPSEIVEPDGKQYKEYFDSASEFQRGEHKSVESKKMSVEHKGSLVDTSKEVQ